MHFEKNCVLMMAKDHIYLPSFIHIFEFNNESVTLGNTEFAELLIKKGADVTFKDEVGVNILIQAAHKVRAIEGYADTCFPREFLSNLPSHLCLDIFEHPSI
jgi:ankyrin repeat protein